MVGPQDHPDDDRLRAARPARGRSEVARLFSRSIGALLLGVSGVLAAAPGIAAAAPTPEHFSAADQYVESLPTSRGSKPARLGKGGSAPLPNSISARLDGPAGAQLEQIATSSDLGAPRERLHGARAAEPNVPAAAVGAIGGSEDGGFVFLLLALLLVSGVVAGIAGHRHYQNRQSR